MLISKNLHKKSSEVSIKTRSTPASVSFIGQVTKHTTVKWTINVQSVNMSSLNFDSSACVFLHLNTGMKNFASIKWLII